MYRYGRYFQVQSKIKDKEKFIFARIIYLSWKNLILNNLGISCYTTGLDLTVKSMKEYIITPVVILGSIDSETVHIQ